MIAGYYEGYKQKVTSVNGKTGDIILPPYPTYTSSEFLAGIDKIIPNTNIECVYSDLKIKIDNYGLLTTLMFTFTRLTFNPKQNAQNIDFGIDLSSVLPMLPAAEYGTQVTVVGTIGTGSVSSWLNVRIPQNGIVRISSWHDSTTTPVSITPYSNATAYFQLIFFSEAIQ